MNDTNEKFKNLLKSRNLRITGNRVKLLNLIQDNRSAMAHSKMQKSLPGMDRVTLYRTIETLLAQGIIHLAYKTTTDSYYALCGSSCNESNHMHKHIHFKCTNCDSVECLHIDTNYELKIPNYKLKQVSISATGICSSCNSN